MLSPTCGCPNFNPLLLLTLALRKRNWQKNKTLAPQRLDFDSRNLLLNRSESFLASETGDSLIDQF